MVRKSVAFSGESPDVPHLGYKGELGDLRGDVEEAFKKMESKVGYPTIAAVDIQSISVAAAATGIDMVITGTNLVGGQTFATFEWVDEDGNGLLLTAAVPGDPAESLHIQFVDGASTEASIVAVDADSAEITVTFEGDVATYDDVKAAIETPVDSSLVVPIASVEVVGSGAAVVSTAMETELEPFEGAKGEGTTFVLATATAECFNWGTSNFVVGPVTDTSLPVKIIDLDGQGDGGTVVLYAMVDGVASNPIQLPVVA